jgi:hypothetical protein
LGDDDRFLVIGLAPSNRERRIRRRHFCRQNQVMVVFDRLRVNRGNRDGRFLQAGFTLFRGDLDLLEHTSARIFVRDYRLNSASRLYHGIAKHGDCRTL